MSRFDVLHMIKRRVEAAGLPYSTCCHTLRATGITTYLQNGGTLEHAQTSPITNRPERLSYTISPARNSRSSKSRASTSKPVPNFASGSRGWFKSQRALLREPEIHAKAAQQDHARRWIRQARSKAVPQSDRAPYPFYLVSGISRISVRIARNSLAESTAPSKLRCSRA